MKIKEIKQINEEFKKEFKIFEEKVDKQESILIGLFKRAKALGLIEDYEILKHKVFISKRKYEFRFRATIATGEIDSYVAELYFCVGIHNDSNCILMRSSSRRCTFSLPYWFNSEKLFNEFKKNLIGWKIGSTNENIFYQQFLIPLFEKNPAQILAVGKANKDADTKEGIDFFVTFLTQCNGLKKVGFNLKSSDKFLALHKSRYPNVSTFLFTIKDLKNQKVLKKRFLQFIFAAQDAVVNF